MDTGKLNLTMKVHCCAPLTHPLDTIVSLRAEVKSEVFQKTNKATFKGIKGIHIVADNNIIAASDVEEHNKILHQVLQRAVDCNIKLNYEKFQF